MCCVFDQTIYVPRMTHSTVVLERHGRSNRGAIFVEGAEPASQ